MGQSIQGGEGERKCQATRARRPGATNSREQQEVVTLSLQLLQNCLMLINTILVERTIEREGLWERLNAADRRALTPLFHGHINPYGQFTIDLAQPSFLEAA